MDPATTKLLNDWVKGRPKFERWYDAGFRYVPDMGLLWFVHLTGGSGRARSCVEDRGTFAGAASEAIAQWRDKHPDDNLLIEQFGTWQERESML